MSSLYHQFPSPFLFHFFPFLFQSWEWEEQGLVQGQIRAVWQSPRGMGMSWVNPPLQAPFFIVHLFWEGGERLCICFHLLIYGKWPKLGLYKHKYGHEIIWRIAFNAVRVWLECCILCIVLLPLKEQLLALALFLELIARQWHLTGFAFSVFMDILDKRAASLREKPNHLRWFYDSSEPLHHFQTLTYSWSFAAVYIWHYIFKRQPLLVRSRSIEVCSSTWLFHRCTRNIKVSLVQAFKTRVQTFSTITYVFSIFTSPF